MPITPPILRKTLTAIGLALLIGLGISTYTAWNNVQRDMLLEEKTDVTYRDTVDGVKWYTYTNTIYGYAISYPEGVVLTRSSELPIASEQPDLLKDARVFLTDKTSDSIFTISAGGSPADQRATNHAELLENFSSMFLWAIEERHGGPLTNEDLVLATTTYQGRPAITIKSPEGYRITSINNAGGIMTVSGDSYTGATTTPKDRLTREIMETFRVLE